MGIVKIRHRGAWNTNKERQSFRASRFDDPVQGERLLFGEDMDDDWDDSEFAEVGCELAMVGDQICNIPYELYSLSNFEDILSLETWNSCLTEDERFYLAAYLPDMDQDTFTCTIKELLRGCSLFFGSPLEKFFHRLKSGLYSLQVSRVRNGLQLFHRRGYYHSLKLYHENMGQTYIDMRKAWSNCWPNTTVEERVQIWNNRRDQKPLLLVDLNAFPADEETLANCDQVVATDVPLLKKTKYMSEGPKPGAPTELNSVVVNTKPRGKGLLKVRPIEMNSAQNHVVQPLLTDAREPVRRPPKGVLKIKPKNNPSFDHSERSMTNPIPVEHSASTVLANPSSRYSPYSASKWHEENIGQNLPFLHHTVGDRKTYRSLQHPKTLSSQYKDDSLTMAVGPFDSHNLQRPINMVMHDRLRETDHSAEPSEDGFPLKSNPRSRIWSNEGVVNGKRSNSENLWQNMDQQSRVCSASPADPYLFVPKDQERLMTPIHSKVPGAIARISSVGSDKLRMLPQFLDYSEHRPSDDQGGEELCTTSGSLTISGVEKDLMFPLTYKRKKAHTKPNPIVLLKEPSAVVKLKSVEPGRKDCHPTEKSKTVKIRVKGWNDQNSQYKKGLLNGLQHGSPST